MPSEQRSVSRLAVRVHADDVRESMIIRPDPNIVTSRMHPQEAVDLSGSK